MAPGPTFSVIVPTHGRAWRLNRALISVTAQLFVDYEIIVADDGAGEGIAIAEALATARIVAFTTCGRGQVRARNLAIAKASGRYVAWLDDDDWWDDTCHLSQLASAFERAPRALMYASGQIVWETEAGLSLAVSPFTAHADARSLLRDNELLVSGVAYPRALHHDLGGFDERLAFYWDWDWYLRVAAAGVPFLPSQGKGVCISVRKDNVSSPRNQADRRADLRRLCAKHGLDSLELKNHATLASQQAQRDAVQASGLR